MSAPGRQGERIVSSTINWTQVQTRPLLMIPGPTELPFPVIQAMNQPPTIQYDRSFDEGMLEPTTLALREVFQTKNEVLVMPGSGRTALEAGALSVIEPGDRVLVVGAGVFGVLMREIMNRVGADFTEFPVEWGARLDLDRLAREAERLRPKAITLVHNETSTGTTYPAAEVGRLARSVDALYLLDTVSSIAGIDVRTDEWGVDLNMTGSQKCLAPARGVEPGLRPPALARPVDAGLARRQGAGRGSATAAGLDPHPSDQRDAGGGQPHPRGGPAPPLPPSRDRRRRRPSRGGGDGAGHVPGRVDLLEHGLVREDTQGRRARRHRR